MPSGHNYSRYGTKWDMSQATEGCAVQDRAIALVGTINSVQCHFGQLRITAMTPK